MAMFDLLSDFVARINNAIQAKNTSVEVLKNNVTVEVCKKLVKLGYLESFDEGANYKLAVKLTDKVTRLKRVSTPGHRVYVTYKDLPKVVGGIGWNILSTSGGIMTNHEAKTNKMGGELLFQIV
jgi:small subunit ribosomal protein S8